jgi:stage II sporulation protein AA (anti-sigma F factor antagonist)
LVANGVRKVLLDLRELTQVDSSGVSIIVRRYVSLKRQGGDLGLLRPGGRVLEVFRVLHLLNTIPTFENEGLNSGKLPTAGLLCNVLRA